MDIKRRRIGIVLTAVLLLIAMMSTAVAEESRFTYDQYKVLFELNRVKEDEVTSIYSARVGDRVLFGSYDLDNDKSNGEEPLPWIVMESNNGILTLACYYVVHAGPYARGEQYGELSWENSEIRRWLNEDFYRSAFSAEEKDRILLTEVSNAHDTPDPDVFTGNDTKDHVYVFGSKDTDRLRWELNFFYYGYPTMSVVEEIIRSDYNIEEFTWWERTPASNTKGIIWSGYRERMYDAKNVCGYLPVIQVRTWTLLLEAEFGAFRGSWYSGNRDEYIRLDLQRNTELQRDIVTVYGMTDGQETVLYEGTATAYGPDMLRMNFDKQDYKAVLKNGCLVLEPYYDSVNILDPWDLYEDIGESVIRCTRTVDEADRMYRESVAEWELERALEAAVGQTVMFGEYDEKPIKWEVVRYNNEDRSMDLIASEGLDVMPFSRNGSTEWEESDLRAWLNTEFIYRAFTRGEIAQLMTDELGDVIRIPDSNKDKSIFRPNDLSMRKGAFFNRVILGDCWTMISGDPDENGDPTVLCWETFDPYAQDSNIIFTYDGSPYRVREVTRRPDATDVCVRPMIRLPGTFVLETGFCEEDQVKHYDENIYSIPEPTLVPGPQRYGYYTATTGNDYQLLIEYGSDTPYFEYCDRYTYKVYLPDGAAPYVEYVGTHGETRLIYSDEKFLITYFDGNSTKAKLVDPGMLPEELVQILIDGRAQYPEEGLFTAADFYEYDGYEYDDFDGYVSDGWSTTDEDDYDDYVPNGWSTTDEDNWYGDYDDYVPNGWSTTDEDDQYDDYDDYVPNGWSTTEEDNWYDVETESGDGVNGYDTIVFGNYRGEPIEWTVIKTDGESAVLLSKNCFGSRSYHHEEPNPTWEQSDIRAWLNNDFLNAAFTAEEQDAIITAHLTNECPWNDGPNGGADTDDKVWLLSVEEVYEYCGVSGFVELCGDYAAMEKLKAGGMWWLRSVGTSEYAASYVANDGSLYYEWVSLEFGVRPAIMVDLSMI